MNNHRVASLLASGLKQNQVATIVGTSPSAICQLMEDEDFKLILAEATVDSEVKDAEDIAIDAKYLNAEHTILDKVVSLVPQADMKESIMALRAVTDRKKPNSLPAPIHHNGQIVNTNNYITLNLPSHLIKENAPIIDVTASKEIVAINERNLAPLPSNQVTKLFKDMQNSNVNENIDKDNNNDNERDVTAKNSSIKEALPIVREESFLTSKADLASV